MILAIDPANEFGWAVKKFSTIESGFVCLTKGSNNHPGKKFELFGVWLDDLDVIDLKEIYYEEVQWNNGKSAARAHCGYVSVLQMYAYRRGITCSGVGVGQIKKFWTGNGRADKDMMIKEANKRGFDTDNDNCADALALLHYVIEKPAEAG